MTLDAFPDDRTPECTETVIPEARRHPQAAEKLCALLDDPEEELSVISYNRDGRLR